MIFLNTTQGQAVSSFHSSFITSYKILKKETNRNTPKHTPRPLKLADLKLKLEAIFCYTLIDPGITSKGKYVRGEEQSLLWAVEVMSTGFMPGPLWQAKDVERVWRLPCKTA